MELVYVSIISGIFGLAGLMLLNLMWYRKEKFKVEMNFLKRKNDLEFKKLAQEYGLPLKKGGSQAPVSNENPGVLGELLPDILAKLPPDTLADLAERFLPRSADDVSEGGVSDMLINFAQENPEIVKSILGGLKIGTQNKQDGLSAQV